MMAKNNYRGMSAATFREVLGRELENFKSLTGIKLKDLEDSIEEISDEIKKLVESKDKHDRRIDKLETAATAIANDTKSKRRLWGAIIAAAILSGGSLFGTVIMAAVTLIVQLNGG